LAGADDALSRHVEAIGIEMTDQPADGHDRPVAALPLVRWGKKTVDAHRRAIQGR
jgi:hypothetical protein